jgi:hypothetical protein
MSLRLEFVTNTVFAPSADVLCLSYVCFYSVRGGAMYIEFKNNYSPFSETIEILSAGGGLFVFGKRKF